MGVGVYLVTGNTFTFNMNSQDDDDILRQMRTLYIRSNKLLRTFHYCSIDVTYSDYIKAQILLL